MTRDELARAIAQAAYLTGSFVLRSGAVSDRYFDKYQLEACPILLRAIARHMAALLPARTEVLAGLELGGVPLATALALETGLPLAFVRKSRKNYGTRRIAEGVAVEGRRVCIVEDVVTTGGQVALSTADLRADGAEVDTACAVLDRSEGRTGPLDEAGIRLAALYTIAELLAWTEAAERP